MKILFLLAAALSFGMSTPQPTSWAEQTLQTMSTDEKIGQLFMIAGYVDPDFATKEINNPGIIQEIDRYITEYHVGGIGFVGPSEYAKQVALTNHYQELSKYPILIAQDLEWGLSMRIKEGIRFPKNLTLGAIADDQLIYDLGKEIGREAKLVGVHMNLSPVLDVNIEPENIVINVRSFGSSPKEVATKGIAMIRGLQDAGIIASAKHFPGLGDISVDPHLGLPFSKHEKKRLSEVELYPFAQAIEAGVLSIQTEHLMVPALDADPKHPASLSPRIVNDLLKNELGFRGLVLSGALRMKALTNHFSDEEITVNAFLAGSDMLLMPQDFPKAYNALKTALADGKITMQQIDERVLKILQLKERVNLHREKTVSVPALEELQSSFAKALKTQLYHSAVTLVRDAQHLVPLSPQKSVAYVQLGDAPSSNCLELLTQFTNVDSFVFPAQEEQSLFEKIGHYDQIVLAVYPADPRRIAELRLVQTDLKNFRVHGISESMQQVAKALQPYEKKTVVAFFGNPFGVRFFDGYSTFIMGHETDVDAQQTVAQIIRGNK